MFRLVLLAVCPFGVMAYMFELNPTNNLWERNDQLLITLDFIYERLAGPITNDGCNSHRRSFSIMARSIIQYVRKTDITTKRVLKKIKKQLNQPADVIAADVRRDLNMIRAIIDQPMNDIKKYCQPNTTSVECEEKLLYNTAVQSLKCPFYINHFKLREDLENLLLAEDFQNLLEEAMSTSVEGNDKNALNFFVQSVLNRKNVLEKMRMLYKKHKHDVFPCMYTGMFKDWQKRICSNLDVLSL
ncbi:hypothetical protein O3G_MSEX007321 [Manduca sexta]|uniref:Uncharacterized protein n=1 Tax=Manduca sexta TaxID=7130 RepID=A0A922CMU3_MANSE|nr:hypothetical protein O3G_MSEX007321 [Manduca sexta]